MPLSDEEQEILAQIEKSLYKDDPGLTRQVRETPTFRSAARGMKWAVPLGIGGFAVVCLSFWYASLLLGVVGFVVMLYAGLTIVRSVGEVGRVAQESIQDRVESWSIRTIFGERERQEPKGEI